MPMPIKLYGGHVPVNYVLVLSILAFITTTILRISMVTFPLAPTALSKFGYKLFKQEGKELPFDSNGEFTRSVQNMTVKQ